MTSKPLRPGLTAASARLREVNSPELAAFVDTVLAPGGWKPLEQTDPAAQEPDEGPKKNFAVAVTKSLREQIYAAVEADPEMKSVTAAVEHGWQEFLAGRFTPRPPEPGKPVQTEERVMINVRPRNSLRTQMQATGAALGTVASEYLLSRYGLGRYAEGTRERLSRGAQRLPEVPRWVRDEIRAQATATGWRVDDVVNEGLEKFLSGEFEARPPRWSVKDASDMVALSMHPNDDLYERVQQVWRERQAAAAERWKGLSSEEQAREKADGLGRLSPSVGWAYPHGGVRPSQVAIDYLLDQFGIDAGE